jgi:hypothetical protein
MKNYKTTTELLNTISNEIFGKNYRDIMDLGRIINGIQGYKPSVKSEIVFKEYLKKYTSKPSV